MHLSIREYLEKDPEKGDLLTLNTIETDNSPAPFVGRINNTVLIGSLALHITSSSHTLINAINLEKTLIIPDLEKHAEANALNRQISKIADKKKKGEYLVLYSRYSFGFWHWVMENLVKVIMAMESGFSGYYIIQPNIPFMRESLELLGIQPEKIVEYDGSAWWVDTLYIPQFIDGGAGLKNYPGLIKKLRKKFLNAVLTGTPVFERIYVARENPEKERKIANEQELMKLLNRYDFKRVAMEDFSLAEQISVASKSRCIIGPHGAGITHCLFMPPESMVIELFSPSHIRPCMVPVMDYLRHRYFMIVSSANPGENYTGDPDITANTGVIELTLKRELGIHSNAPVG